MRDQYLCLADARTAGTGRRVIVDPNGELPGQALELRAHLALLAEERLSAHECGLAKDRAYAEDLSLEVGDTRVIHSAAVILQLAFLRAAIDGRSQG